jgi:hypothetical protein
MDTLRVRAQEPMITRMDGSNAGARLISCAACQDPDHVARWFEIFQPPTIEEMALFDEPLED